MVVAVPGLGDGVQTIKAGVTEIADVFVVNMADRPGAHRTATELEATLRESGRNVPVIQTTATTGAGVEVLASAIRSRESSSTAERLQSIRFEVVRRAREYAMRQAVACMESTEAKRLLSALRSGSVERKDVVENLLSLTLKGMSGAN